MKNKAFSKARCCTNFCAFSLIELLITLIIISLLIGAFIPVITKKLKASDVTVGSFSNSNSGSNSNIIIREVTKADCDELGALYIPSSLNGGKKPVCATKWNMGDNGLPLPPDVIKLSAGQTCTNLGNCCWSGKTATSKCTAAGNADSTYSGCNRTVCHTGAAEKICSSYQPNNKLRGTWRTAKKAEIIAWADNLDKLNNNMGTNGLQLCTRDAVAGAMLCPYADNVCNGGQLNRCNTHCTVFDSLTSTMCYDSDNYAIIKPNSYDTAVNIRCVLDGIEENVSNNLELKNNAPKSQADCDKFNALFIPASMNDGTNNICVTKWNMGDNGLPLAAGTQIVNTGGTCTIHGNCCWKGQTATAYISGRNGDSSYSGQNRTVCLTVAGKNACANYKPNGTKAGDWRLPTTTELEGWGNNIEILNAGKGKNGLQLCSANSLNNVDTCSPYGNKCISAAGSYVTNYNCHPYELKATSNTGTYPYCAYAESDTRFIVYPDTNTDYTGSVRCVYDGLNSYNIVQKPDEKDDGLEYREPRSQADCNPYNAMFVPKEYNGAEGKNLCVTKFNAGDTNGPEISDHGNMYINLLSTGSKLDISGRGCWKGATSGICTTDSLQGVYPGCGRTVCTAAAAIRICSNWSPNNTIGYWRLPTETEISSWANHLDKITLSLKNKGLQLCDSNTETSNAVRCSWGPNMCKSWWDNVTINDCYPNAIWASRTDETKVAGLLSDGKLTIRNQPNAFPASVRCVTDKVLK